VGKIKATGNVNLGGQGRGQGTDWEQSVNGKHHYHCRKKNKKGGKRKGGKHKCDTHTHSSLGRQKRCNVPAEGGKGKKGKKEENASQNTLIKYGSKKGS